MVARGFYHVYIDAFAGPGVHISRKTGSYVLGSPLNALEVQPSFREFFFIDIESEKADLLREYVGQRDDVHVYAGDCNDILLKQIFPNVNYSDFRRGLLLLDPYGLHLNWEVVLQAGQMKTIDLFLNFPIMDMNRNSLWRQPERVGQSGIQRMNAFWGDESWKEIAYRQEDTLFGPELVKEEGSTVVEAYRQRLKQIARFEHVSRPLPMRNNQGALIYYLLFASQKRVAEGIVEDIFRKYETRGMS